MSARILVVDDHLTNVKLLEARLTAEYFEVRTALSGVECLAICEHWPCDIVLLDVMMPGMDGIETCRRLKANARTAHIPVVMVTALDQPSDRVKGLEAGADDFLTKPVDETALLARVRSLTRLKQVIDELRERVASAASLRIADPSLAQAADRGDGGTVLLVEDRPSAADRIVGALSKSQTVEIEPMAQEALFRCAANAYDLVVISLSLKDFDGLRLLSQLRSLEQTRHLPVLIVSELEDDRSRVLRGLDLGANDYLMRPIDRNELIARVRTQVRRKRTIDALRGSVQASIELAVIDTLTGLHNRRYLEGRLTGLLEQAAPKITPFSVMIIDIDHFKRINDTYGHDAGDDVLREIAARLKTAARGTDSVCRLGGEEFVIVTPNIRIDAAQRIAERLRIAVESEPFVIEGGRRSISVTISIGVADRGRDRQSEAILKRADKALYRSKAEGRNRVTADAA